MSVSPRPHVRLSRSWGSLDPHRRGHRGAGRQGAGLTEDEDVLQALEEGVLEILLLLPGQLLGDHAAVTQASPQPVGAGVRGRSEEGD